MSLLDIVVGKSFGNDKAGRVVVLAGDKGNRGYVVKSDSEERKIRSFLKMFYFAQLSIQLLGLLLTYEWSRDLIYVLGRPVDHLLRSGAIFLGTYCIVVVAPYVLLWRTYRKSLLSFVSIEDQVVVSEKRAVGQRWGIIAGLGALALATLVILGIAVYLVRTK
jgi:hypothetical protein